MFGDANNNLSKQDINTIKVKLAEQREDLIKTIETHKLKLLQIDLINPDRSTLAKAFTQREHMETIIGDAEYQWTKVDEAFERVNQGTYGKCSHCKTNINIDRLKVIPATMYCVECQKNKEKNNRKQSSTKEGTTMLKKDGYQKGDWIVHAYHGVGQIKGLDRKAIDGVKKTYFRVKTKTMTYWLPVENSDVNHIRPVASKNIFTRSLKIIRKKPREMAQDYRVREKDISEAFSACSIKTLAALIRDLYGWRIAHSKKSMRDGDILTKAKNLFIDEYAIAVDIDLEDARKILENALRQSVSSLRAKTRSLDINTL